MRAVAWLAMGCVAVGGWGCSIDCADARRCGPQVLASGGGGGGGGTGGGAGGGSSPFAPAWAVTFGDAEPQRVESVALAPDGSVFLAGSFRGTVSIGGSTFSSLGGEDVLVARLDEGGSVQWAQRFGDANLDAAKGVAVDAQGDLYVAGTFAGTIDLGGDSLASGGGTDVFVAKLTAGGAHVWSKVVGGAGAHQLSSLDVAPDGSLILGGSFDDTLDTESGPLTSAGGLDGFAVALDADGNEIFSRALGGGGDDTIAAVAVDADGSMYAAGAFQLSVDFGDMVRTSDGGNDAFVVALDALGQTRWSTSYGDPAAQAARALAAGSDLVVAGDFAGTVSFGTGAIPSSGGSDVFVLALDPSDGASRWVRTAGDGAGQRISAACVSAAGDVFVAGEHEGTLALDGASVTAEQTDGFVLVLDGDGQASTILAIASDADASVLGIAASENGTELLVGGAFSGTIDLAPVETATSNGATDGFATLFSK